MRLDTLDRHSAALFELRRCPVCPQAVVTPIPFEGVCCTNCHTQDALQESRETRGFEAAVLACFTSAATWTLHVDETLRRPLPEGSARVTILGAPGAYEVDWLRPEPGADWEPVERGKFDDVEAPAEVSHLASGTGVHVLASAGYLFNQGV
jgi:hypothetical protein